MFFSHPHAPTMTSLCAQTDEVAPSLTITSLDTRG